MAFTYNLASSDPAIVRISQVRLHVGDTTSGAGVRPDGTNLQDEELAVFLNQEGNDVMRGVAATCEALARQWAIAADIQVGPRRESLSQVATRWSNEAKRLREQVGGAATTFSTGLARDDGYTETEIVGDTVTGGSLPEYRRARRHIRDGTLT